MDQATFGPQAIQLLTHLSQPEFQKVILSDEKLQDLKQAVEIFLHSWEVNQKQVGQATSKTSTYFQDWAVEKTDTYYDEISLPDGQIRKHYEKVVNIMNTIEFNEPLRIDAFPAESLRAFKGDNKLYHIPRILSEDEHAFISAGVLQRAKAICAFIQDHYSGGKCQYLQQKIIPRKVINSIMLRNDERKKFSLRPQSDWSFWYGPDIIRGSDGKFYICEDNLGYLGDNLGYRGRKKKEPNK